MAVQKQSGITQFDDEANAVPIRELTEEEALAMLDKQARQLLDMSGEEFLAAWRADRFSEEFASEHHSAISFLSLMALPFGR